MVIEPVARLKIKQSARSSQVHRSPHALFAACGILNESDHQVYRISHKTTKTALYHSIKCGNLAESQGFELSSLDYQQNNYCKIHPFTTRGRCLSSHYVTLLYCLSQALKGKNKGKNRRPA